MSSRWTVRTYAALALIVVSLAASLGTWISYQNARHALSDARAALTRQRTLRKLTDLHFCHAINESRRINNRDRQTFIRSRTETRQALGGVKDPVLHTLLAQSLKQSARELAVRPKLPLLPCVKVIQHPSGKLPPAITSTETTPTG